MVRVLRKSPFLGVGMDESRDRSSEKHVVFVVRYLDGDAMRASFLQIEKVADIKAKTMYDCPTSVFEAHNISTKKVCIASLAYSDDD